MHSVFLAIVTLILAVLLVVLFFVLDDMVLRGHFARKLRQRFGIEQ